MKKIILIPDSFKGTMSSEEICGIMRSQVKKHYPNALVVSIPIADGGEGSVDCFLSALGGQKVFVEASGPFSKPMQGFYGLIDNGETAVVEMAACAGLPLVGAHGNPMLTSTCGVGELIMAAVSRGTRKVIVGLGGSATNDGGCGAACAVGVRFYDKSGQSFVPTGGTLKDIARIDMSGRSQLLDGVKVIAMCDIDNPMYGPTGAAHVFAPQKGAGPGDIALLDDGLRHLGEVIKQDLGLDLAHLPGAGAAGAMGAGMIAFFDAGLQMGIEAILDAVRFDELAKDAGLILTGEGKIDRQSLRGKVVIGVARRAKRLCVPVVAVVGDIGDDIQSAYDDGVSAIFSINRVAADFSVAKGRARDDMALTIDNLMRFIKTFS